MIITLLAWIYITFLCWLWGCFCRDVINKFYPPEHEELPHFTLLCSGGFIAITVIAGILSLFIPLGGWQVQLLLLLPPFLYFLFAKRKIKTTPGSFFPKQFVFLSLLVSCLLLLLVMSSWRIIHPDTIGYHAQTIRWIEEYKAIPGLVNLHNRYGYQGLWFVACAVFSFKFTGIEAVTFINTTILAWYFIFIIYKITRNLKTPGNEWYSFLWLSLGAISLWNYTQVRLTATSASPDFIATLLVLLVFYLLVSGSKKNEAGNSFLILVLSVFTITLKLSTAPLLLTAAYAGFRLLKERRYKQFFFAILCSLLFIMPFITRNIITSGYAAFPSPFPNIVNVDWKFNPHLTALEKKYITAYARTASGESEQEIKRTMAMQLNEWLPVWWKRRSVDDKFLITLFLISIFLAIIRIRTLISDKFIRAGLLFSIAGIIFWFIQAPDPRFGAGFILAFSGIVFSQLHPFRNYPTLLMRRTVNILSICMILVVIAYSVYRLMNYFSPDQIVRPQGIGETSYHTLNCSGVEMVIPTEGNHCADLPLPCVYDSCRTFELRGTGIQHGFRGK